MKRIGGLFWGRLLASSRADLDFLRSRGPSESPSRCELSQTSEFREHAHPRGLDRAARACFSLRTSCRQCRWNRPGCPTRMPAVPPAGTHAPCRWKTASSRGMARWMCGWLPRCTLLPACAALLQQVPVHAACMRTSCAEVLPRGSAVGSPSAECQPTDPIQCTLRAC